MSADLKAVPAAGVASWSDDVDVLVMLDQALLRQLLQGAGHGAGVDDVGTGLRYGVVELGVPEGTVSEGGQDGTVQLSLCDVEDGFEIIRQRDSPPPTRVRERTITLSGRTNVRPPFCDRRDLSPQWNR